MNNNGQQFFELTLKNGIKITYKKFKRLTEKMAIYIIINSINHKIYIGSTINVSRRKSEHFNGLKNNNHPNKHLQNSYDKYGENAFSMYLLEYIDNKEDLLKREQYWIDLTCVTNRDIGYNISPTAGSTLGTFHSEEFKEQRRILSLGENNPFYGKKHSSETLKKISNSKSKPIFQFDLDGNFIKEWESAMEIQNIKGYTRHGIYKSCNHKVKKYQGYIWIFKEDAIQENFKINDFLPKPYFNNNKSIYQCDLEGNIIKEWDCISKAARELEIQKQRIIMCCKGKIKTYKNFIWKYKLSSLEGGEIIENFALPINYS